MPGGHLGGEYPSDRARFTGLTHRCQITLMQFEARRRGDIDEMNLPITILTAFRKLFGRSGVEALQSLQSVEQMYRILERERARASRTREGLSVVIFAPRSLEQADATWAFLAETLRERLRLTDAAGWLDDRLCAILPGTATPGATKLVDDICGRFPDHLAPPICTIYAYSLDGDSLTAREGRPMLPNGLVGNAPLEIPATVEAFCNHSSVDDLPCALKNGEP